MDFSLLWHVPSVTLFILLISLKKGRLKHGISHSIWYVTSVTLYVILIII